MPDCVPKYVDIVSRMFGQYPKPRAESLYKNRATSPYTLGSPESSKYDQLANSGMNES
jgi:hypothetical protein